MRHKLQIVNEWNDKNQEDTVVYLDDNRIYVVDKTMYAGIARKNCEQDICNTINTKLQTHITPRDLSTIRILESFDDQNYS